MPTYKIIKNGSLERPHGISKELFISSSYGTEFTSSLNDVPLRAYYFTTASDYSSNNYRKFKSLKNTINYYSGYDDIYHFNSLLNQPICLLAFNSLHLGSGIKKDSVTLKIYKTGSIMDYASDSKSNGVLYNKNNEKVGFVLYSEGYIILNNTGNITNDYDTNFTGTQNGTTAFTKPKWIYYGAQDTDTTSSFSSSILFYDMEYSVKENLPTLTTFIAADKGNFNHSNNITYIESGSYSYSYNSGSFEENKFMEVKNVVKSTFTSGSAEFEKETYISKIGLYDKDKKLIGYASLATPIRKTENREYLFKLKLDL